MVCGLAQHDLLALVPADDAFFAEPRQDGPRRRAADAELGGDLRLRRQCGIRAQGYGIPVVGFLEDRILPCHQTPLSALVTVVPLQSRAEQTGACSNDL